MMLISCVNINLYIKLIAKYVSDDKVSMTTNCSIYGLVTWCHVYLLRSSHRSQLLFIKIICPVYQWCCVLFLFLGGSGQDMCYGMVTQQQETCCVYKWQGNSFIRRTWRETGQICYKTSWSEGENLMLFFRLDFLLWRYFFSDHNSVCMPFLATSLYSFVRKATLWRE